MDNRKIALVRYFSAYATHKNYSATTWLENQDKMRNSIAVLQLRKRV